MITAFLFGLGFFFLYARKYSANTGLASALNRSSANALNLPPKLLSRAVKNSLTQAFTSMTAGHGSRRGGRVVDNWVNPTPKLMSSTSWSAITSSELAGGTGGFSRSLRSASQVYAHPFLYLLAKAAESVRVFVSEITAVLRSMGRMSFWVVGRMMLR